MNCPPHDSGQGESPFEEGPVAGSRLVRLVCMRRRSSRSLEVLSLVLAVATAACGGSDDGDRAVATTGNGGEDTAPPELEWGQPVAEGLRTGGQPNPLDLERAAAAGYTTVISLRTEGEPGSEGERATVERLGMTFVQIPVAGADDLTVANARALDAALDAAAGGVLLHCGSGNRAGSLLGLRAYVTEGATADEAMSLARGAGMTRLEPALKAKLEELCEGEPDRCPGTQSEVEPADIEPVGPPVEE